MRYRLLRTNEFDLAEKVEGLLREGWQLQGSPFHIYMDGYNWFCQALILPRQGDWP